jgi:hypothetical protein
MGPKPMTHTKTALCILAWIFAMAGAAHATDDHPGDYIALPPGTNVVVSYSYYGLYSGAEIGGVTFNDNTGLQTAEELLRLVHYGSVFGHTIDFNFFVPYAWQWNAEIDGVTLKSANGFGNPLIASTFWLLNQPQKGRYVALTPLLSIPLGEYHGGRTLNIGDNRWSGTLEGAWVEPLIPGALALELNGNATWYGDNPQAGSGHQRLSQDPAYQLQPWLHWYLSAKSSVALGYFGQFGGAQRLEGLTNGLGTREQAIRVNFQHFLTPTLQLSTTVSRDVAVSGGFKQAVLLDVRLALAF